MIRFKLATVACLLAAIGSLARADAPLANGGFESPTDTGAIPGWTWSVPDGDAALVGEARSGEHALHLRHSGETTWRIVSAPVAVEPGAIYLAEAWLRLAEGSQRASIRVVFDGPEGEILSVIPDEARLYPVGAAWRHIVNPVRVPKDCHSARVVFIGTGEIEAWIDDVGFAPWQRPAGRRVEGWMAQRPREKLGRGMVAVSAAEGLHVSWRLLADDAPGIAFDLYRRREQGRPETEKLNERPIVRTSDYLDRTADPGVACLYAAVPAGTAPDDATEWSLPAAASPESPGYLSIPLAGGHDFQKVGVGDLDGDGRLDYVIKQPDFNVDPYSAPGYWKPSPETFTLEAYRHDGTLLWKHDLGRAIEEGIWYSPYLVCDLDGDGRCEVVAKTGPEGDPRNAEGKVVDGPEYLSVFEGATGKLLHRTDYLPPRDELTGPRAYNIYNSRNQLAMAYLDGKTPCLIVERGTYALVIVQTFQFRDGRLEPLWTWRSDQWPRDCRGQGAHSIRVGDVDADGRDEMLLGSLMLDDDGTTLWTTGQGHPDHTYLGDLDPQREGLEIYLGLETRRKRDGMGMVDAATGRRLWGWDQPTGHVHDSGLVSDLVPDHPGAECYGRDKGRDPKGECWWFDARGKLIGRLDLGFSPRAAYWDADPQRELLLPLGIRKFGGKIVGPKIEGRIVGLADLWGDWREEVIAALPGELRIYTTPLPAQDRHTCLLQDAIYRADVMNQSMGYLQVPTLSYDMATRAAAQVKKQQD